MTRSSDYLIPGEDDGLDVFLVVLFGVLILGSLYGAVWLWEVFTSPPYSAPLVEASEGVSGDV